jgi:threonine synthase
VTSPPRAGYGRSTCTSGLTDGACSTGCQIGELCDLPTRPPDVRGEGHHFPTARGWVSDAALAAARLNGVTSTPLLRWRPDQDVWLKCDHLMATGSFKDRGAVQLTARALDIGASELVTDSSGNAGAALAAHAARAGLRCAVFIPTGASAGKERQIAAYGARLELVTGPREAARTAARAYAEAHGAYYASHMSDAHFLDGTKSWWYEVSSDLDHVETVVLPVGSGSLLLGVLRGIEELVTSGWTAVAPRIVIAQAAGYASLASSPPRPPSVVRSGNEVPLAEGIALTEPPRLEQMRRRLRQFETVVCPVGPEAILAARSELAHGGLYVEPTSAAVWAAWRQQPDAGRTVIALTGHGLKSQW